MEEMTEAEEGEITDKIYEWMCIALYSYRSGHLGFIELLEKLEEIAAISRSAEEQSD
jgi:hypothetical protein